MCLLTLLLVYFVIGYALLISLGLKYGWRDYSVKENITAFTIGAILWLPLVISIYSIKLKKEIL